MEARDTAVHCEAKKHGYRQTQDGVVVSFVIHPNDVPDALALFPLGTRVMLAVAEVGDDEQPVPAPAVDHDTAKSDRAKANFAALAPMKKDVVKAAMMVKDATFQKWILGPAIKEWPRDLEWAADYQLKHDLDIQSKAEIGESREVNERWRTMLATYQQDTGQMAEVRS